MKNVDSQPDKVNRYYQATDKDYKNLWAGKEDLAVHFGYYDEAVTKHSQSLVKMNEVLANLVQISPKDRILDAGCGYGGTALWLAKNFDCHVIGINIVPFQLKEARELAQKRKIADKVEFKREDFTKTSFPDQSFDIVWGHESIVHTDDKEAFVKEASRLLKTGGRLIIAEYMLKEDSPLNQDEKMTLKPWLEGWSMPNLITASDYKRMLLAASFNNIQIKDITKNVKPSVKRLALMSNLAYPFANLLTSIGVFRKERFNNIQASVFQTRSLNKGLWKYIVVTAVKS